MPRAEKEPAFHIAKRDGIRARELIAFLQTANPDSLIMLDGTTRIRFAELEVMNPDCRPIVIVRTETRATSPDHDWRGK